MTDVLENDDNLRLGDGDNDRSEADTSADLMSIDQDSHNALNELDENTLRDREDRDSQEFDESTIEDPELEQIKAKVREMEEEAEKLKQMQAEAEEEMNLSSSSLPGAGSPAFLTAEEKKEIDCRSIYVGNVDYGATAEELEQHFHGCGSVNRVTILCDKFSGHPKGFAYVEFSEPESIEAAKALDESLFRGRQIKVTPKRTNIPGHSTTNRGRGRGYRGRGRGYGFRGYRGGRPYRGGFRGRGRYHYSPY